MRPKDLDSLIRGWRHIDLSICADGSISVCLANTHFGRGDSVRQALDMALLDAERRKRDGI